MKKQFKNYCYYIKYVLSIYGRCVLVGGYIIYGMMKNSIMWYDKLCVSCGLKIQFVENDMLLLWLNKKVLVARTKIMTYGGASMFDRNGLLWTIRVIVAISNCLFIWLISSFSKS